jgi:hypothetical protein
VRIRLFDSCSSSTSGNAGEKGSKDCPLYYNGERDVRYVSGRPKFDPGCRRLVRRSPLGDALPALEALLKVFS